MSQDRAHGERPRPAYGEYATPEEQRARIQQPDATRALAAGQSLAEPAHAPPSAPGIDAAQLHPEATGRHAALRTEHARGNAPFPAPRPARRGDRIATFALLGYGLFTVVTSIPPLADYDSYVDTLLRLTGADLEPGLTPGGQAWGIAAALVLGLGWLVTAAISWRSLRSGRLTWWIPLLAGVVFNVIASLLMIVPLVGDPAVWDAIVRGVQP